MFNAHVTIRMIISGLAIMITGFLYEAAFSGIPYQDLALKLAGNYQFQSIIANGIFELGLIAVFAGLVLLVVALVQKFLKKSS